MADTHLKSTLEAKCVEVERHIEHLRKSLIDAQNDLVHLRGVISIFERDLPRGSTVSSKGVAALFRPGELYSSCSIALRNHAGGLDNSQLAAICLEAKGLDADDRSLKRDVARSIGLMLNSKLRDGTIITTGKRGVARIWALPSGMDGLGVSRGEPASRKNGHAPLR